MNENSFSRYTVVMSLLAFIHSMEIVFQQPISPFRDMPEIVGISSTFKIFICLLTTDIITTNKRLCSTINSVMCNWQPTLAHW